MKEYLFRAWDKKEKQMHEFDFGSIYADGQIGWVNADGSSQGIDLSDKNIIITQYMGITDRSEKKIFEGDVLEIYPNDDETDDFRTVAGEDIIDKGYLEHHIFDLIGNIFENPELEGTLGGI